MKKIIYILALLLVTATANAQEVSSDTILTQDVNIVRDYVPAIKDAGKINTLPVVEKPQTISKGAINYSTWVSPLPTQFNLQTLPSATLKRMKQTTNYREGYARIGAGNYTSFLGDFYIPVLKANDYRLDFSANHLSTFGKVKLENDEKVKAKNMTNGGQLAFNKNFHRVDMFSSIEFNRRDFNYYGLDSLSVLSAEIYPGGPILADYITPDGITLLESLTLDDEAHNMFDFTLGFASRPKNTGINYAASVDYELTNTKSKLTENHIQTKGYVSTNWDVDELGLHLSLDNLLYNDPDPAKSLYRKVSDQFDNYSILALKPFYKFRRDTWSVKLGLKAFFSFNKGDAVSLTPDIDATVALVPDIFYLYGGITGDLKTNSMRSMFDENQYLRPDVHVDETYTPIDAYAGIKLKFFEDMIFNVFAGYKYIDNQYFFVNHQVVDSQISTIYNNSFDVVLDEANLVTVGASVNYNWNKSLYLLLKGVYNNWSVSDLEYAWHKPDWQIDLDVSYKVNDDIKVSANMFALGKRYANGYNNEAVKLKPVFDLSLSGTYEYTSWLSFFLDLNNIFAQNYQIWYGYNSHRFNAMAGAMFSF